MKILDVGHKYQLLSLDGNLKQILQFVKRYDPEDPLRFPGNKDKYPGTTLQDVIQCLCNRVRYLDRQIPCIENKLILKNFQESLVLLEQRAARRHGLFFDIESIEDVEFARLCPKCGHTICEHTSFEKIN